MITPWSTSRHGRHVPLQRHCDFCLPCALAFNTPSHTVLRVMWLHHPALGSVTFKAKTKCEKKEIVCKSTTWKQECEKVHLVERNSMLGWNNTCVCFRHAGADMSLILMHFYVSPVVQRDAWHKMKYLSGFLCIASRHQDSVHRLMYS